MRFVKSGLLVILLSVFAFQGFAQKNFSKEADFAYYNGACFEAMDLYKKAYAKEKNRAKRADLMYGIGKSYHCLWDYKQAASWYRKAIKGGTTDPKATLYLADALKSQGLYEEAIVEYNNYKALAPSDKAGEDGAKSSELSKKWMDEPTRHVVNPEAQLNSRELDFSPTFADRRMNTLIFTSQRPGSTGSSTDEITGQNFSDLYESKRDKNGKWSTPVIVMGEVNSDANEGAAYVNQRGNTMYYSRCGVTKNEVLGCSIFKAKKQGAGWTAGEQISLAPDSVAVGHPALDDGEKFMIFASDMEGGFGGNDLWLSTYDRRAGWSKPVNLGSEINTAENEMYPYLHDDGSLYFSSAGHPGMGGLDLFKAEKKGEMQWGTVINLKYPMNSPGDDFGIIFEGAQQRGFFTSNRDGGMGGDDIFSWAIPPLVFVLQGTITNKEDKKPIPGAALKLIGSDGSVVAAEADATGFYKFSLSPEVTYDIRVEADKFLGSRGKETTVGIPESTTFIKDFALQSTIVKEIPFPEVQYALGKWELTENSKDSLNFLYQTLIENPRIVIELSAHTDSRGSDAANQVLSEKRAKSCVDYLISKGIEPERMRPKGYGERRLLVTDAEIAKLKTVEEKEAAHQRNRRTVFSVLRTDYIPKGGLPVEPEPPTPQVNQPDLEEEAEEDFPEDE